MNTSGNVAAAADQLGCSRYLIYRAIKADERRVVALIERHNQAVEAQATSADAAPNERKPLALFISVHDGFAVIEEIWKP